MTIVYMRKIDDLTIDFYFVSLYTCIYSISVQLGQILTDSLFWFDFLAIYSGFIPNVMCFFVY